MNVVVATRNRHKLDEIRHIFAVPGLVLLGIDHCPGAPEVVEDGDTFEANAVKKAVTLADFSKTWTLADDSGLEVQALGDAPGVFSARYAGEPVDYARNNRKLLDALRNVTDRRARFRCVAALASPTGEWRTVEGRCEGRIIDAPRGRGGFGYDPIFVPDGHRETFAEMDADLKNRISHRAAAFLAARKAWGDWLMSFPPDSQVGLPPVP